MTVKNIIDRQLVTSGSAVLGIAQIGAGNEVTFGIRPGTHLLRVLVHTTTAFDGTTNTLTATDGTTVFANAVDVKTTGSETVANAPKYYPSAATLTVSLAQTGTATAGEVVVVYEYILRDNGDGGIQE